MRLLVAFFISVSFFSCSNSKDTVETQEMTSEIEPSNEIVVEAKLIRKKAYNKAGVEMPYAGDFYLQYNEKEMFVKLISSKVTSENLESLLDKKSKFKIVEQEGLWDTDNPNIQSRIGPFVEILEIIQE